MQTPFVEILKLLTEAPGNLIYHLVLAFSILSSLQAAAIARRGTARPTAGRLVIGFLVLLLAQAALYIVSGLTWQQILNERAVLPPLDRAVLLLSVLWIAWLWNFPTRARLGDVVTGIFSLAVIVFFLYSYYSWSLQSDSAFFNMSFLDQAWVYSTIFMGAIGLLILLFTRPPGWGFGFGTLALLLGGCAAHLLLALPDSNLSPYLRLGQMAAYPLLPTLLQRLFPPEPARAPQPEAALLAPAAVPASQSERRRYAADPRAVHHWLGLVNAAEPAAVPEALTRALAHTLLADICYLVNGPTLGSIVFPNGYDLIREQPMDNLIIEKERLPRLASALQAGKPLCITPQDAPPQDLAMLANVLGFSRLNDLLFIPLKNAGDAPAGLVFLSPYANRTWTVDDQNFFGADIDAIAGILRKAHSVPTPAQPAVAQVSEQLREQAQQLREENRLLLQELSELRQAALKAPVPVRDDHQELLVLLQDTQAQIARLQAENERLQAASKSSPSVRETADSYAQLENELRSSLQDIAALQNQLAEANARNLILEHSTRTGDTAPDDSREVISALVQETRQPMSSIIGYTELMLSESVGMLVPTQRKFVERIRSSNERLRGILDDLLRVASPQEEHPDLLPQTIELGELIDSAVAETSAQLREKNIALRVDLPGEALHIVADRDAVYQVIVHLLRNAGSVTPPENSILLRARRQAEHGDTFLMLQVTDMGGGVPSEDIARIFSRRYKAETPLLEGVGDTGVGLSIAKTLVETQGGRIWVDSVAGESTTYSVLLPLQPASSTAKPA